MVTETALQNAGDKGASGFCTIALASFCVLLLKCFLTFLCLSYKVGTQTVCIVPDAFLPKQYKANVTVRKKALSLGKYNWSQLPSRPATPSPLQKCWQDPMKPESVHPQPRAFRLVKCQSKELTQIQPSLCSS